MKQLTVLAMLCYALSTAQINEDFSSKNLIHWQGDCANFTVNSAIQLQSNASAGGSSWIVRPYELSSSTYWELWMNMAFSPSTTNKIKVYLYADHAKIDSITKGFYFTVGESGTKDSYDFYLQRKGKADSLLISGVDGLAGTSNNKGRIKIEPFNASWIIYLDAKGGENFTVLDTLPQYFSGSAYFGIYCKYSASNAKKFFFDDITIDKFVKDTIVPKYGDIVISEIMADPELSIGLAEKEYVELYNASAFPINLKGWTLSVNGSKITFPKTMIAPHEFLVLYDIPALLNEGCEILLSSSKGDIIHSVSYSSEWYGDPFKAEGGWSLEIKDVAKPCLAGENWSASNAAIGGTPGKINSLYQNMTDDISPKIEYVTILDSNTVSLHFSELVYYNNQINLPIDSVFYNISPQAELKINLKENLLSYVVYTININASDCSGNSINGIFPFAMADSAAQNDIVINEILYNPKGDGSDFVEIYNRSNKFIDLSSLRFSSRDTKGFLTPATAVSTYPMLLFPGEYAAFTTNPENIIQQYPSHSERIFKVSSLPALNNDEGNIVLILPNGTVIDEFHYTEKMQDGLLNSTDGVSLERINPSNQSWHSAAESIGFATPGLQNSQFVDPQKVKNEFKLSYKIITPNQDGNKDFAEIIYQLEKPGYKATILIFDASGNKLKTLADNVLLATNGDFQWMGTTDSGELLPAGIYILYAEYFHPNGEVKHWKESLVLER
ncbi:MAG: lamin tail domain-containing protein [Bacteroidetes bacterium]|nr:lamin tail domain-containing protein [Bacteroidota bacterium]